MGHTDAWTYIKEARGLFASIGDRNGEAETICRIAEAHITAGSFEEGGFIAEEGTKICRSAGLRRTLAKMLHAMADGHIAEIRAGCPSARTTHLNWEARKKGKEALAIFQELGDLRGRSSVRECWRRHFSHMVTSWRGKQEPRLQSDCARKSGTRQVKGQTYFWSRRHGSTTIRKRH